MKTNWILMVFATLALIAEARAVVSVKAGNSCSDPSITDTNIVTVQQVAGNWEVRFKANATGEYWICGDSGDVISIISSDTLEAPVTVNTIGNSPVISAIEKIEVLGEGQLNIGTIRVVDRIGPATPTTAVGILVNNIGLLTSPAGSLNCAIKNRLGGYSPGGNFGFIRFPESTIRADIRNENPSGTIGEITCKNIQGTSTDPVDIVAKDSLTTLIVGTFDANGNPVGGDATFVNIGDPTLTLANRTMQARDLTFARDFSGHISLKALRIPAFFGNRGYGVFRTGRDFSGVLDIATGLDAAQGETPALGGIACKTQVRIGRTFTTGSLIQLPMYTSSFLPLTSQIIIDDGRYDEPNQQWHSQGGQWLGTVGFGYASGGGPQVVLAQNGEREHVSLFPQPLASTENPDVGGVGVPGFRIEGTRSQVLLLRAGTACARGIVESEVNETVNIPAIGAPERFQANLSSFGEINTVGQEAFDDFILERRRQVSNNNYTCYEEVPAFTCPKFVTQCRSTYLSGFAGDGNECVTAADVGGHVDWCAGSHEFLSGWEYRLRIRPGAVVGSRVAGIVNLEDMPAADGTDQFTWFVGCLCVSDIVAEGASSGKVDTMDLTKFLGQFGMSQTINCASPTPSAILVSDLNLDGVVNTSDLVIFLGDFGTVCCAPQAPPTNCACSLSENRGGTNGDSKAAATGSGVLGENATVASMPTPPGPVLAALGFTSTEAFQAYVDTLTDEQIKAYLALVLAVAQSVENPTP
jgi:hypothetical protein